MYNVQYLLLQQVLPLLLFSKHAFTLWMDSLVFNSISKIVSIELLLTLK